MIYTQRGLDWALNFIDSINADPSKYVIYKQSRPIANLKHMMVTTTDLYPNNTAFMMKFPGTKEYESISFTRVLEEMNALGTALIAKGLKGKRIAVCGENCYYWCLSYLAAVCGVGVVVPLDKELPDGDLKGLATAAEVACVFTTKKHQPMFEEMLKDHEGSMEYVVGMYTKPEEAGDVLSLEALIQCRRLFGIPELIMIPAQQDLGSRKGGNIGQVLLTLTEPFSPAVVAHEHKGVIRLYEAAAVVSKLLFMAAPDAAVLMGPHRKRNLKVQMKISKGIKAHSESS